MRFTSSLETLQKRGFTKQCSDPEKLDELMSNESVTLYAGFDPTGPSLHIGHMVPLIAMAHLQNAGHKPIALVGGGTARIGDPSGKTEMRKILSIEQIRENIKRQKKQISRFIDFSNSKALLLDNAEWLAPLNYIDFLREIGRHFSVNRMLSFETYKMRLESGLSFIEFNYQLLQAYDFLTLNQRHNCTLQLGGDDQWGNIVAGIDLTRRVTGNEVFGLTFNLVTRADGKKMGKTEKGALFLDPEVTTPYDFFQYWRNIPDADVEKMLLLFTFLEEEMCRELGSLKDKEINRGKELLAYEVTKIVHGEEEAEKARDSSKKVFYAGTTQDTDSIPSLTLSRSQLDAGIEAVELFAMSELCASKSEARRLIKQGGGKINDIKITAGDAVIDSTWIKDDTIMLRAGKKRYFKIVLT
jgi:tyrosyl-tRNA synthetase